MLTPLTLHRTHPVELALGRARSAVALGLVTGVFYFLFGAQVSGWDILGVDAVTLRISSTSWSQTARYSLFSSKD